MRMMQRWENISMMILSKCGDDVYCGTQWEISLKYGKRNYCDWNYEKMRDFEYNDNSESTMMCQMRNVENMKMGVIWKSCEI